jgi:hypothetical protein
MVTVVMKAPMNSVGLIGLRWTSQLHSQEKAMHPLRCAGAVRAGWRSQRRTGGGRCRRLRQFHVGAGAPLTAPRQTRSAPAQLQGNPQCDLRETRQCAPAAVLPTASVPPRGATPLPAPRIAFREIKVSGLLSVKPSWKKKPFQCGNVTTCLRCVALRCAAIVL